MIYAVTVRNTGNTADTFDMTYENPDGWTTSVTPALVNLLPDATAPVMVSISIPLNADAGGRNVATVTATSQGNPTISASSTLTTTVWEFDSFLPSFFIY